MTIDRIIEIIKKNKPDADVSLVQQAYNFSQKAHAGQTRLTGEEYIEHAMETAYKLASINLDLTTVAAGLLHDVPEDTEYTFYNIEKEFGKEIANLIQGVTKLGKIKYRGLERYAENLRKMFIAMAEDVRVIFIKFADRIHNLKTLYALPPVKQQRIARESLEIYAPIAGRLGMEELKGELEDLSFPYVLPEQYEWIQKISKKKYEEQKRFAEKIKKILIKNFEKIQDMPRFKIEGRAKRYYSLYQKILRKNMDIDQVYDIVALRIIVENVSDCYKILGYLHQIWKPMKGRIKDYIAQPKPNGYQSLHTTVFGHEGRITEFQIRTEYMHEEAEWGIAAHWAYKNLSKEIKISKEKIKWIKELLLEQKKETSNEKYLANLKLDFFKNRIFVFTPKGDVIDLPENATPVDFAYHIHSDLGNKCFGAKVNEKKVNLNAPLQNGDMVEILIDKKRKGPAEEWLSFVQTHIAQNKIKNFLKKQKRINIFRLFE